MNSTLKMKQAPAKFDDFIAALDDMDLDPFEADDVRIWMDGMVECFQDAVEAGDVESIIEDAKFIAEAVEWLKVLTEE